MAWGPRLQRLRVQAPGWGPLPWALQGLQRLRGLTGKAAHQGVKYQSRRASCRRPRCSRQITLTHQTLQRTHHTSWFMAHHHAHVAQCRQWWDACWASKAGHHTYPQGCSF